MIAQLHAMSKLMHVVNLVRRTAKRRGGGGRCHRGGGQAIPLFGGNEKWSWAKTFDELLFQYKLNGNFSLFTKLYQVFVYRCTRTNVSNQLLDYSQLKTLTTPMPRGSTKIATATPQATPTSIPEKACLVTGVSSTRLSVRAS